MKTTSKVAVAPDIHELFAPITKMYDGPDGFFVEGVLVAEEPDRTHEIWDYASSKRSIIDWAEEAKRRTAGKSAGNLRSMHGNVATGRFMSVVPNDSQKLFEVRAEVVDEQDKEKCRKGVYSGFSIKAPYHRKWPDPKHHKYTRWTSGPVIEGSLVDLPCIPGATFNIKVMTSDRTESWEEVRKFASSDQDPYDLELEALATRVAEKLERGHSSKSHEEESDMDYKAIAEKRGLSPDAFKLALGDALDEISEKAAGKCMKSAGDCKDADCDVHGKARKADPDTSDVTGHMKDGAPRQPSTDNIKGMICIGETADGIKVYKVDEAAAKRAPLIVVQGGAGNEPSKGLTAEDIATAVAAKMAPLEKAFETIVETVAGIAQLPRDSKVAVRTVDRASDGKGDAAKAAGAGGNGDAEKSAAELVKEGRTSDAIKNIHAGGPAMVLSNRGIERRN